MRVAVIGAGRMGRRHIEAARRLGLTVSGIYDISATSLQQVVSEFPELDGAVHDDLERMYAAAGPELVIVASTADSHCGHVCDAAERGARYVLVEKPMAISLDQCSRMMQVCERKGATLAVNHQMRFMDQYIKPRALLESDAYGGISSMTVVAGNFGLAMNGSHYFEAFTYMCREAPVEISAWFSNAVVPNPRGPQFMDRGGCVRAVSAGGKRLYMELSTDQGHGVRTVYAARYGAITIDELTGEMITSVRQPEFRELPTTRYGMPALTDRMMIAPAEVIDTSAAVLRALISGKESVDGSVGFRVVRFLVAAFTSAEQGGRAVKINEDLDASREFPWA